MRKVLIVVGAVVFGSLLVLLGASMGVKEARAAADPVMLAAGDIASCESRGDEATAELLDDIRGRIVTLGDNAYPDGSLSQFRDCYGPSWGRHKDRTRPAPGNHEYYTPGAEGYFDYFGARAGNPAKGYYSYDRGTWHIVVLNSNCSKVGGCEAGSAQGEWLRADLAAHPNKCTLAYFHAPSTAPARSTATAPTCARSGRPSTGRTPKWCSPGTITTTSASPPRTRTARSTARGASASSWWARAARTYARSGPSGPTAGSGMPRPTGC